MKRFFTLAIAAVLVFCLAGGASAERAQTFGQKATFEKAVVIKDNVQDASGEMLMRAQGISLYDDFLVQNGSAHPGIPYATVPGIPFVSVLVGNASNTLTATSPFYSTLNLGTVVGADAVSVYGSDKYVDANKSALFVTRVRFDDLCNGSAEAQFGLADNYAPGAYRMAFDLDGSGAVNIQVWNGSVSYNGSSGITVSADEWHTFMINAKDVWGVAFSIDGKSVGTATSRAFKTNGAARNLRPFWTLNKTSTGTGKMDVDYVRIWQDR